MRRIPESSFLRGFLFYGFISGFAFGPYPNVLRCGPDLSQPSSATLSRRQVWHDATLVTRLREAKPAATLPRLERFQQIRPEARLMILWNHNGLSYKLRHQSSKIPDCLQRLSGGPASRKPVCRYHAYGPRSDEHSSHLYLTARTDLLRQDIPCEIDPQRLQAVSRGPGDTFPVLSSLLHL